MPAEVGAGFINHLTYEKYPLPGPDSLTYHYICIDFKMTEGKGFMEIYWLIAGSVGLFSLYYLLLKKLQKSARTTSPEENNLIRLFLTGKFAGAAILGLGGLILYLATGTNQLVYRPESVAGSLKFSVSGWLLIFAAVFTPVTFLFTRFVPKSREKQPELRLKNWSVRGLFFLFSGWAVYLFGYEFFFRQVLFFPLLVKWGWTTAVIINIFLYALAHGYQGPAEIIISAVLGYFFCLCALQTGTFITTFISHFIFSFFGCLFSIIFNPDMTLFKKIPS